MINFLDLIVMMNIFLKVVFISILYESFKGDGIMKKKVCVMVCSIKMYIISIFFLVVLCFIYYYILKLEIETPNIEIIKNVILIIISVFGSTLLSTALIEKKKLNKPINDFLFEDILTSTEILSDSIKKQILNKMEMDLYYDQNQDKQIIMEQLREEISLEKFDYFYESCVYDVKCEVENEFVVYNINRGIKIKSFDKNKQISDFCIAQLSLKKLNGQKAFEILEVLIDDQRIEKCDLKNIMNDQNYSVYRNNEYDTKYLVQYRKNLNLDSKNEISIQMHYIVRLPKDDNSMVYRVYVPCKKFRITCSSSNEYKLKVHPFGIGGKGFQTINNLNTNSCTVEMENWIFPYDGVVTLCNKIDV